MPVVVAAALCERGGRVLVTRRPEGRPRAGLWELPGGKLEPREAPERALARELLEELGVASRAFRIEAVLHHCYEKDGPRDVLILVYRCEIEGEPQAREVAEVLWAGPEELRRLPFLEADQGFVAALAEKLERGG